MAALKPIFLCDSNNRTLKPADHYYIVAGLSEDGITPRALTVGENGDLIIQSSPAKSLGTDHSGSITLGGTAQVALAAKADRAYLFFQNVSDETMWINFNGSATAGQGSIKIIAGAAFVAEGAFIPTGALSVVGTTTGKQYTIKQA